MHRRLLLLSAAAACLAAPPARATALMPPPIDLGIANIPQRTPLWCWAAVAEQIIAWRRGESPPQCALVAAAFGASAEACCGSPRSCFTTGGLGHIQGLIAPPAYPMALYQTLAQGRPVILAVRSTPFNGHVVVLRGMAWMATPDAPKPVLLVNDPLSHFTRPVPFLHLLPYWQAAIIVA